MIKIVIISNFAVALVMFTGTANRNTDYLTKLLGDRPMLSETTWALPKSAVVFNRTSLSLKLVRFASTLTGGSTF